MPNPILHLRMDGNARDSSGNGNHGSVNGATLTEDRFGNPNSAHSFDGTDYIECTDIIDLNNEVTVTMWIEATTPSKYVADFGIGYLYVEATGVIRWRMASFSLIASPTSILNKWVHVVAQYSKPLGKTILYINGELVATETDSQDISDITSLKLGSNIGGSGSYIGKLDDIRIYDTALTPSQVKHEYDITKRNFR